MAIIYVPRVFGGTLIINTSASAGVANPLTVNAYARDGKVNATARDGNVNATARDGQVTGTGR